MSEVRLALPKPEIKGVGHVTYRCAECAGQVEPDVAFLDKRDPEWRAYHMECAEQKGLTDGR